jgi:hypothetical protein
MKPNSSLLVAAVAASLVATVAQADGIAQAPSDTVAHRAVYQGTDAQGRVVQLTIADIGVPTLVRIVPEPNHTRSPELHWSSQIGTGQASSLEH